ncbi:MAG: hypothetical protein JW384_01541 [Nitrosomonadaceae bacterium]|nr:hypothetical protein [Nitrosomonadaceae bacterium]
MCFLFLERHFVVERLGWTIRTLGRASLIWRLDDKADIAKPVGTFPHPPGNVELLRPACDDLHEVCIDIDLTCIVGVTITLLFLDLEQCAASQ